MRLAIRRERNDVSTYPPSDVSDSAIFGSEPLDACEMREIYQALHQRYLERNGNDSEIDGIMGGYVPHVFGGLEDEQW